MTSQTAGVLTNPSLIPFVVGVTGRRYLRAEEVSALESAVRSVFDGMRRRMPHTPLILLSGLAEGADQLVAKVALSCSLQLGAALATPGEQLRTTRDVAARQTFDELLAQASVVINLPNGNSTESQPTASTDAKEDQCEALAIFLATHCQALISLWDGVDSQNKRCAANAVRYMLEGPPGGMEDEPLSGPVYHIETAGMSEASGAETGTAKIRVQVSLDDPQDAASLGDPSPALAFYEKAMRSLDSYNRDAAAVAKPTGPASDCLLPVHEAGLAMPPHCRRLAQFYRAADQISLRFNGFTKKALVALLLCAMLAITGFESYAHVLQNDAAIWLFYPVSLLVGWIIYHYAKTHEVENRYLDCRALAEALRIQFFWSLAGIPDSAADYYLQHHRSELDWIRSALRGVSVLQEEENHPSPGKADGIHLALKHWVEDQKNWYARRSTKQKTTLEHQEKRSEKLLFGVWLLSIVIPLSLLVPWGMLAGWKSRVSHEPYRGLLMLLVTLPTLAIGLFRVWVEQSGFAEHARKYHRMANVFRQAAKKIEGALRDGDIDRARETLFRLGVEALEENGDWLLLHRERPLKVLAG